MRKSLYMVLSLIVSIPLFVGITTAAPLKVMGDTLQPAQEGALVAQANTQAHNTSAETSSNGPTGTENVLNTANANSAQNLSASTKAVNAGAPAGKPAGRPQTVPSANSSTNTAQSSKAAAIISTAKKYIGVSYVWGGTTPAGFDCSGFVQYVFAKNGISLPRISRDQFSVGKSVSYGNLQPGDLVFFSLAQNGIVDHEGIYIGGGQFLNASTSKGVTIYSLGPYWQSYFIGAKRIL